MLVASFVRFTAAVVAVFFTVTVAVAHADPQDDQFLGLLARDGINAGPPDQLVALAHERCTNDSLPRDQVPTFRFGPLPSAFATAQRQLAAKLVSQGLTDTQVKPFLLDAISVYCPSAHS